MKGDDRCMNLFLAWAITAHMPVFFFVGACVLLALCLNYAEAGDKPVRLIYSTVLLLVFIVLAFIGG